MSIPEPSEYHPGLRMLLSQSAQSVDHVSEVCCAQTKPQQTAINSTISALERSWLCKETLPSDAGFRPLAIPGFVGESRASSIAGTKREDHITWVIPPLLPNVRGRGPGHPRAFPFHLTSYEFLAIKKAALAAALISTLYFYFINLGGARWTFSRKHFPNGDSKLGEISCVWGLDKNSGIHRSK